MLATVCSGSRFGMSALLGAAVIGLAAIGLGGCASNPGETFATPDDAVNAAVTALRTDNQAELTRIFGPDAEEALASGDPVADQNNRALFLQKFDEKHALIEGAEGSKILEVGTSEWPMPIPLVRTGNGWRFDLAAGKDEMLSRRIGRNELDAIQTLLAIGDAQDEYFDLRPQGEDEYASKFFSDPGQKNGLFWPVVAGEQPSPMGELVAEASAQGYKRSESGPTPFHGYIFRPLTAQGKNAPGGARDYMVNGRMTGGYAVVAFPAEYGRSGIMTFMMSDQGVVFQRDLGSDTASIAGAMTEFDPDLNWTVVSGE
ncbi:MAG: DUF2950 domain-containing protein [Planctomycetes bacterium]|nr:DUF2950 domain-containing protein [Planctomycetota bacterium]